MSESSAAVRPNQEEIQRKPIGNPVVVRIKVPKTADYRYLEHLNYKQYLHFGTPVSGGFVNWHVHNIKKSDGVPGSTNVFSVQAIEKVMPDGRTFIMFDLTPSTEKPTHERKVYARTSEVPADLPEECFSLDVCDGRVVFVPITE